jgi:hypothetical protein
VKRVGLTLREGTPSEKSTCPIPMDRQAYDYFKAMCKERGREEVIEHILFEIWGPRPIEWLPYAPGKTFKIIGSTLVIVLQELDALMWDLCKQATLQWYELGDWDAPADYADSLEKVENLDSTILAALIKIARKKNRRKTEGARNKGAKRGDGTPRSQKVASAGIEMAMWVFFQTRCGAERPQAVTAASERFGKAKSQIYAALREYGEFAQYWVDIAFQVQLVVACFVFRGHALGMMTKEQGGRLQGIVSSFFSQEGYELPAIKFSLQVTK